MRMDSSKERRERGEEKKNILERKIFEEIMTDISHIWAKNFNETQAQETWRKWHYIKSQSKYSKPALDKDLKSSQRKQIHNEQKNKDKDDSRFLVGDNASEKSVEQYR